jgi:tetratricopeptide (TPR) repeat protein
MKGYTAKDVARMLDLSVDQVRSFARAGFLDPDRGDHGEYRFSFQDLVLLRTAKGLTGENVSAVKVRNALLRIKQMLPQGQPLSGVQLRADGDRIVIREGDSIWSPDSGQTLLNFDGDDSTHSVSSHSREEGSPNGDPSGINLDCEEWFGLGIDLEDAAPDHAREAYRRTLELNPNHVTARINLGRLLHAAGQLAAAEAHYDLALGIQPRYAAALFYRGALLEETGRNEEAITSYRSTIDNDPGCAEAYLRLARLHDKSGDSKRAGLFLDAYKELTTED